MYKINVDRNLDPDFGKFVPPVECAYWVTVLPDEKENPPYRFILFMPTITDLEMEQEYLTTACIQLVGDDDADLKIKQISDDDYQKITKSTIIATFNPNNPEEFFWLTPPYFLKH